MSSTCLWYNTAQGQQGGLRFGDYCLQLLGRDSQEKKFVEKLVEKFVEKFVEIYYTGKMEILE